MATTQLPIPRDSLAARLFDQGYDFQFFQAVRLLERLSPERHAVGLPKSPFEEIVRFRALPSLSFPPSQIYELVQTEGPPEMTVAFLGLTGPSGVLPRHYTELILRLHRNTKGPERTALRDWFDLFNHRFISLFYRAWQKYRFWVIQERGDDLQRDPDLFTLSLLSMVGQGTEGLRGRLRVSQWDTRRAEPERTLAKLLDSSLLFYGGLLSRRVRSATGLESMLRDYFGVPAQVIQFQGQWLELEPANQSRLGEFGGNNALGVDTVAGERVWDVQGKFRVCLGPLGQAAFLSFLPDPSPAAERKAFFLLLHLVRYYAGPEFSFDIQLILRADEVLECKLDNDGEPGPRLGWNTWLQSQPAQVDARDAIFEGEEIVWLNPKDRAKSADIRS